MINDSILRCLRLKFCTILPKLKSQMKLPKDMQHLQQLELEVRKLLAMEKDNDVVSTVRSVSQEGVFQNSLGNKYYLKKY